MQNMCAGDNEKFLNLLADVIGKNSEKISQLEHDLGIAEDTIRRLDEEVSDASWATNPDRSGGAFTDQEIEDSTTWR